MSLIEDSAMNRNVKAGTKMICGTECAPLINYQTASRCLSWFSEEAAGTVWQLVSFYGCNLISLGDYSAISNVAFPLPFCYPRHGEKANKTSIRFMLMRPAVPRGCNVANWLLEGPQEKCVSELRW